MSDKGAHFFRCDLQVHSPRDINWSGLNAVTNEERRTYARELVQACRERGLQGIAITDHHDMFFARYIRDAAQEETNQDGMLLPEEQRLVVFPGMELTLGVPCQALLLFDAEFPEDLFALAMNALAIPPNDPTEAKTAQTRRLDHITSLKGLKEALDTHKFLRDRYTVLPNVTNEGQFSIFRVGLAGKYAEMPWVGGYTDGPISRLTDGIKNRIAGKDKAWGHKRIACFQTSDNRRRDHNDLGTSSTWIKWATPSAEALRQACLAQESRVSQESPTLPSIVVSSMSVSNSTFLGPVDLELNPQYSALIGGRGTGKSTILEYLRWALCDQPPGFADDDIPNYQVRRSRLIDQTLKPLNATVEVRFEVNNVPHVIRRYSQDGSLKIKISDDEMRPCTDEEVRTLLPIQAYSQKQLSDVSVRVDELGRFVTAPIRSELVRIDRQLTDRATRVRQPYATRLRQRAIAKTVQLHRLEEKSLSEQASAIRASLTGLSDEEKEVLERGKRFDMADRSVQLWRDGIVTLNEKASSLLGTVNSYLEQLEEPAAEPEGSILKAAHEEYRLLLADAAASLDGLIARASTIAAPTEEMNVASPWRKWSERLAQVKTAYEAAVQRSSAHSDKMLNLKDIDDKIGKHAREIARVGEELRDLATAESTYVAEQTSWQQLLKERDDLLDQQCEALTTSADGAIRAQVRRFADPSDFVDTLRQSLAGSRVQGGKLDALGESITNSPDPTAQWNDLLLDLEKLADFDVDRDGANRRPETPSLVAFGLTAGEKDRLARRLKSEEWLALSLTPVKSVPVFEYRSREGEYIPFRNASAGQQATALLKTLLNQVGPPLIIDQPEEDLDNPVMLEIVGRVWEAKQNRQLIFASHNANLVVNGDAELVAWCDYRMAGDQSRGTIVGEGAIDIPGVREAIKRIMEGGAAAFHLRKEKYGF